jgi:ribosome-binding factor A
VPEIASCHLSPGKNHLLERPFLKHLTQSSISFVMQKSASRRAKRLEETILQELAKILIEEIQDPRLVLVTLSGVRLNVDLTVAEILYTHSGEASRRTEVQKSLESARGYIRSLLGKRLKLKYVPQLRFKWDDYLEEIIYESSS